MTKLQWIVTASCIALFGILYFGFDTKPSSFKEVERNRALTSTSLDINQLVIGAVENLPNAAKMEIATLDEDLSQSENEKSKVDVLKKISGFWYKQAKPDISGYYASQIAEIESTVDAWHIAGSTYTLGLQQLEEGDRWDFCYDNAITAYQNAISLDPEYVDSRINLALCYVERAPENNPMKGITMLLDLNKKYPKNIAVMTNLGKLAVRTNQLDKARIRFEKVLELENNNNVAICYLSEIFKGLGDIAKANKYEALCRK